MTYGEIAQRIAKQRGISKMSAQAVGGAVGTQSDFTDYPLPPCCRYERKHDRIRRRH